MTGTGPVRGRHEHVASEEVAVALVLRVHGDAGVGGDRLGPRGGDDEVLTRRLVALVEHGVAEVPERAGLVVVLDLEVGERGAAVDAPVDDALAAVDEAVLVEVHERLAHGALARLVHRERLAFPVGGGAEPPVLLGDARARAPDELPDALQERLAADVVAGDALGGEFALDERVDGDGGVVDAGQPQRVVAEHAVPAHERVLDGDGEGVADVQLPGEVGRRHDHGEGPLAALGAERARRLPLGVDALLDRRGVVGGGHRGRVGRRGIGGHGRAPRWSCGRYAVRRARRRPAGAGRGRPARPSARGRASRRRLLLRRGARGGAWGDGRQAAGRGQRTRRPVAARMQCGKLDQAGAPDSGCTSGRGCNFESWIRLARLQLRYDSQGADATSKTESWIRRSLGVSWIRKTSPTRTGATGHVGWRMRSFPPRSRQSCSGRNCLPA